MSLINMAADNKTPGTTPRGKAKKKSALAKLVERKKRQAGITSDVDSEYGSRLSLQNSGTRQEHNSSQPLEQEVIIEHKSLTYPQTSSEGDGKPKPKPRRNSKVSLEPQSTDTNINSNDSSGIPTGSDEASKKGPSESTIYRFRNMRMAADQHETTDGLKQGPFVPKPPSTPRTPRNASASKGEKRNHEPNSSGDEMDLKRQVPADSESAEGKNPQRIRWHSEHSRADKQIDNTSAQNISPSHSSIDSPHKHSPTRSTPKDSSVKLLASPAISSARSGGSDIRDMAEETIDQVHHQYKKLIADTKGSPQSTKPESMHSGPAMTSLGSQKLYPVSVKNTPPPMDVDMESHAMRTAYKSDPTYKGVSSNMHRKIVTPRSDGGIGQNMGASSARLGSDNLSFTSTSVMPVITTQEARSRSFLVGSVSSGSSSILGPEELERYFPDRRIHVFSGSWNMNELKELSVNLNDFILPEACEYVQDIYAIGTQENEMNKREWEIRIQETLGPSHVLFHAVSYGSLHLAIFIRRDLIWFCSVPEEDMVSLRAVTMVKTKGAIGISFTIFGTSMLFINCHLTSDRGSSKNAHRLLDYHKVTQELKLPHHRVSKHAHPATKLRDVTACFDCVFWCGDLNFRLERRRVAVEGKVSQMTADDCIPHFEELLGGDQLSILITEGKIFEGFQEGRINFQPTFKFDVNLDNYDSSSKNRTPSYTDRILFRSRKKNHITCLHYDAVMNIKVSDHRAVYALFEATLRPGRDNILLCSGQFDREVYLEANKRRAQSQLQRGHKHSSVCVLQ